MKIWATGRKFQQGNWHFGVKKNDHSKWKNLIEQEQKTMKTLPKLWLSRRKNNKCGGQGQLDATIKCH